MVAGVRPCRAVMRVVEPRTWHLWEDECDHIDHLSARGHRENRYNISILQLGPSVFQMGDVKHLHDVAVIRRFIPFPVDDNSGDSYIWSDAAWCYC